MATNTPILEIMQLDENQNSAEITVNEALLRIDRLAQLSVLDRDLTSPPGSPSEGVAYIVPTGATGSWAGADGMIAFYYGGWRYVRPKHGWRIHVRDEGVDLTVFQTDMTVSATFNDNDPSADSIDRASGSFIDDGVEAGMYLRVENSSLNDGRYVIGSVAASTITLDAGEELTDEGPTADVILSAWKFVQSRGSIISPSGHAILLSPLPRGASTLTLVSGTAYWVYLGYNTHRQVMRFVELLIPPAAAGSGAQTAELGLFYSTSPPNRANQTINKIDATGTVDDLTTSGLKRNTSAFTTPVPAGVHLWAGIRTAMATTQPSLISLILDMSQGFVLATAAAGALTGSGPWTGAVIGTGVNPIAPDLRGVV